MASPWAIPLLLQSGLSRFEVLNAMREGLDRPQPRPEMYPLVLGIIAVVGLVLLVPHLYQRRHTSAARDYLSGAARRLNLGRTDVRALRRIARRAKLTHPVAMLLSPGNLAFAVRLAMGEGDGRLRRRAEAVSRHVFGVGLPATPGNIQSDNSDADLSLVQPAESSRQLPPHAAPAAFDAKRFQ